MSEFEAFRTGILDCLPRLHRYARVLTPTPADADDLLQQTCERALSRFDQFRPGSNLKAWLFTIMSSVWKNELRARAIRNGQGFVGPESLTASDDNRVEGNIFTRQVFNLVMGLPETQRETLMLVYVEGYRYEEAAQILDVPTGTIMSRLSRARLAIAGKMDRSAAEVPSQSRQFQSGNS